MLGDAIKTIMVPDWDKIDPEIIELIKSGHMRLREGVIYWNKGKKLVEGAGSIVKHLPFKEMTVDLSDGVNVAQLAKATATVQNSVYLAAGLSTGVIVGAIVIQTVYLSKKLEKIQASIDTIAVEIQTQNQLFYLEKLSSYIGSVMAAHELVSICQDNEALPEIAAPLLASLAQQRNELCTFLMKLIGWIEQGHGRSGKSHITQEHAALVVDFITHVLDMMPKAIYVESALYTNLGHYHHADTLVENAAAKYHAVLHAYRQWARDSYDKLLSGESSTDSSRLLTNKFEDIKNLLNSLENKMLLGNSEQLSAKEFELIAA
ncbi:hypothetical protein AYI74_04310 [Shewanella algae]|nr:hypothetical protein AYI74_04310 [Shewanella algae]